MNPLLNRIYETKNQKYSKGSNNVPSSLDRALVPKIPTKVKLQSLNIDSSQKIKNGIFKNPIVKLPTLFNQKIQEPSYFTEKKIQLNKSRAGFRSRRMSTNLKDNQISSYFPTEFNEQKTQTVIELIKSKQLLIPKRSQKKIVSRQQSIPNSRDSKRRINLNTSIQNQTKQQNQLFEYLNVLQTNQDLHEQFCYMNRHQLPYSFYIVDYQERNKNQYLTVSLRGITYFNNDQDQFLTIKQFSKDIYNYKRLQKVYFFQEYLIRKTINHWKIAMIKKKFINQCQFIKNNLLSQNQIKNQYLIKLHQMYQDFCKGNFFAFSVNITSESIKQFKNQYMLTKRKQIQQDFSFFQQQISKNLSQCNKASLIKFRKQKRVTLGTNQKLQKEQTYLPYDNKKKAMKYTQLAKLKQFQQISYKLIKYTDLVRYNLKIQFGKNSLIQSIKQMQNLYSNWENRNTRTFVSWIQCKIILQKKQIQDLSHNNQLYNLKMSPKLQEIKQLILQHKNQCLKVLWNHHSNLIQRRAQFSCTQYHPEGQLPLKGQLKQFFQKNQQFIQIQNNFERQLNLLMIQIQKNFHYMQQKMLKIFNDSCLDKNIQSYLQNQTLRQYLQNYEIQKKQIQKCQQSIEFGLILLKADQFKFQVQKKYQEKYKAIITAIPQQVNKRTKNLIKQVKDVYNKFKENPHTVKQYIQFSNLYHQNKSQLIKIQMKIQSLKQLELMIFNNGIKISETSKLQINQSQTFFRQLQKRFQQIQQNQQKQKKKFQAAVENMIPQIQQKSQKLLKQLSQNQIIKHYSSQIFKVNEQLNNLNNYFSKVKEKKEQLFIYQKKLELGHKDLQNYFKLQIQFQWFKKLWNGRHQYLKILQIIKNQGYGQIQNLDISFLTNHIKDIDSASMDIQALQLMQQFKNQTNELLHIIKLAKLISTDTLQVQHMNSIKNLMKFKSKQIKDLIFTRQGSRNITSFKLFTQTNIVQIQNQISEIAFLSSQQSIINKQLNQIQEYWRKNKIKFIGQDILCNGTQIIHLDQNQELLQKIGLFMLTLKNIQNSSYAKGPLKQRLDLQVKITFYVRKLLSLWMTIEKQWLKLLPMMTNCPSVKHQSNVFFEFTAVDTMMKKLIKQINDMSSMRKLVQDYEQKKNIQNLQKCGFQLRSINRIFNNFLETKRSTYNRFYFLTDQQLVAIIENVKDSKTFSKYGNLCFNCDTINMDNELINGFQSVHEIFKLRKTMLRGEPDQMFKSISQNMKNSLKSGVRTLVPKMKIATNIQQQLRQNSLQVCLISDYLIWTQMTETYLNATSYDQYQILLKRPFEQMTSLLPRINKQLLIKLSIRLVQATHLKQIGENMINDQVTKNDFKWKQQLKLLFQQDQISIRQFNDKIVHGLQYYPPQKIHINTLNTEKFFYQTFYTCLNQKVLLVNGPQGEGKRNLIKYTASNFGIYQKQVICNSNLKINYLMRFVQGALSAGAWLSFYECSNLENSVIYQLFDNINKYKNDEKCHPRTMFLIVNHQYGFKNINAFKFNSYTVVEPDHKRICQMLFQKYRFRQWQALSQKLIAFIKIIKPLMQNMMGSPMSLIRRIVDGAGNKKINSLFTDNETHMVVQLINKEIIEKCEQNLSCLMKQALISHFNIQIQTVNQSLKYNEKREILKELIQRKDTKNIIVIGNRSCKTNLIKEAIGQLKDFEYQIICPQAHTQFLTTYSIDYFNLLPRNKILVYDGDQIITQFLDLITSGYLLIQGRKVVIKQKIIMELRNIQNTTPSFIQNCDILYVGNLISKLEKFKRYCFFENQGQLSNILQQIFGQNLVKLEDQYIEILAKFIVRFKDISHIRTIHKIISWFMSVLDNQSYWNKNYGGKYTDFTVHQKFLQLVPIDPHRSSPLRNHQTPFYYVPTKSTVLITQLTNYLKNCNLNVLVYGQKHSGKTSIMKLLKGQKNNLKIYKQTQNWTKKLKKKLLLVRRQGKNCLIPIGDNQYKIIIDDLDLGTSTHQSFLRKFIEFGQIRDSKYQLYFPEDYHIVMSSRTSKFNNKLDDRIVKIPLNQISKQSLSTIFSKNVQTFVKLNHMNRQVIDFFQRTVIKILNVAYDDLSNLFTSSIAASQVISILKNLISLPKKNSYISVQDFQSLFKCIFYQKITQKNFHKKINWQLSVIYENICKIFFSNQTKWDYWLNIDSSYRIVQYNQVSQMIKQKYPHLIIYKSMIEDILYINNQLNSINAHIILMGRKGVGKKHLAKMVANLNKITYVQSMNQLIFNVLNNQQCILIEQINNKQITNFQKLSLCEIDQDLEQFLQLQQKQKFRKSLVTNKSQDSIQIIIRIKKFVKHIILVQDKSQYMYLCESFRKFNLFGVCFLEQWPSQAIVQVYKTNDNCEKIHAQIFSSFNSILIENNINSMSMTKYEKYIEVYSNIYNSKLTFLQDKKQEISAIFDKFNQSCSIIKQWQSKISTLQSQMKLDIQNLQKIIFGHKISAFVTSVLAKQFSERQLQTIQKKQELQKLKYQMQNELKNMKLILQRIEKIIASLQRSQMSEMKKIYRNNRLAQFGLECLCILFKEEVSQKSINKLLADPNLLMKMKSNQILSVKNQNFCIKFNKQIVQLQVILKNSNTQNSKVLIQWLRSIIDYWHTNQVYSQKIKNFNKISDDYIKIKADFDKVSIVIKDIYAKSVELNKQLAIKQKEKKEKEEQILTINKKLQNSAQIIPILLKAEQQLDKTLKTVKSHINNLIANCILFSVTAVYLPLCALKIKQKMIQKTKRILRQSFLSYSDFFIDEIIDQKISTYEMFQDMNSLQDMNIYLLEKINGIRIIIDPERKSICDLEELQKNDLLNNIHQKLQQQIEQIKQNSSINKIYHSVKDDLKFSQKFLIIDWKITAMNPKQKIFYRISMSKKNQYFKAKKQLKMKIHQNLIKIQDMKLYLYHQICQSKIKILDNDQFVQTGKQLIKLQQQTDKICEKAKKKIQLIKNLQIQIKEEVQKIFILSTLFKQIRPVSLDLLIEASLKQGNSVNNVIKWALSNLSPKHRNGWLFSVGYHFQNKPHPDLLKEIIIKSPLKSPQFKSKKPALISVNNWQKIISLSTYTQHLKQMIEITQKNQKQFQVWINDHNCFLPKNLQPQNLSFIQHLFLVFHLKPKLFPQTMSKMISQIMQPYEIEPLSNKQLITKSNSLLPIVIHSSIYGVEKLANQLNGGRVCTKRIGCISSQSQLKRVIWKSMQQKQWLCFYGISKFQDLNTLQKIVYYVQNYQRHQGFRVIIINEQYENINIAQHQIISISSSKYLSSLNIHVYDQIPTSLQLMNYLKIQPSKLQNDTYLKNNQFGNDISSENKKYRKKSFRQEQYQKKMLLQIPKIKQENLLLNNGSMVVNNNRYLNRLYKHLILAHICLLRRFQFFNNNHYQIIQRIIKIFKYIQQKEVPIQFNVESIVNYIEKIYILALKPDVRRMVQQIIQRIIDQLKFNEKFVFGVNISDFNNVQKQLINNSNIIGAQHCIFNRQMKNDTNQILQTLNLVINPQQFSEQIDILKGILGRNPILLHDKQVRNKNYLYIYKKEQKIHNQSLKQTYKFLQWLNNYTNKQFNSQQVEIQNQYIWNNLLKKTRYLIGQNFSKNQLRNTLLNFSQNLKKSHDFLLYFNPSLVSFTINPLLIKNFRAFISTYIINFYEKNKITDATNYMANLQFRKVTNQNQLAGIQGLIFKNFYYRDFIINNQQKSIQPLIGQVDGQEKAPFIIFRLKKLQYNVKEQDQIHVKIPVIYKKSYSNDQEQIITEFQFICNNIYPQFYMKNNSLILE